MSLSSVADNRTAYVLAGSFVGFLIESYGLEKGLAQGSPSDKGDSVPERLRVAFICDIDLLLGDGKLEGSTEPYGLRPAEGGLYPCL